MIRRQLMLKLEHVVLIPALPKKFGVACRQRGKIPLKIFPQGKDFPFYGILPKTLYGGERDVGASG